MHYKDQQAKMYINSLQRLLHWTAVQPNVVFPRILQNSTDVFAFIMNTFLANVDILFFEFVEKALIQQQTLAPKSVLNTLTALSVSIR